MSSAMVGFIAANWLFEAGVWDANPILSLVVVLLVAMVTSTLVAILVERVAYRKLRNAPRLIPLITSIGVSFFIQYTFASLFGVAVRTYPQAPEMFRGSLTIGGFRMSWASVLVIIVAILSMIGLWYFVTRTKAGQAMRAVAEDKEIAALMGIDVDRTIVTVFAVGGAMAGVAALMWALLFPGRQLLHRLPARHQGIHLGGAGRHRQPRRGDGRRCPPRAVRRCGPPHPRRPRRPRRVAAEGRRRLHALVLVLVFRPSGLFSERLGSEDRV